MNFINLRNWVEQTTTNKKDSNPIWSADQKKKHQLIEWNHEYIVYI